jgi:hypothetical protein
LIYTEEKSRENVVGGEQDLDGARKDQRSQTDIDREAVADHSPGL